FAMGFFSKLAGSEFVNSEDRGQFVVEMELPGGTALEETSRLSALAEKNLLRDRDVPVVFSTVGPLNEANKARWRVVTTPKDKRTIGIAVLKDRARTAVLTAVPTAQVTVTDPPFVEGAATEAPIMIDVRGNTYEDIVPVTQKITKLLKTTPGVQDVQMKF